MIAQTGMALRLFMCYALGSQPNPIGLCLEHHRVGAAGEVERLGVLLHKTIDVPHTLLLENLIAGNEYATFLHLAKLAVDVESLLVVVVDNSWCCQSVSA